MTAPAAPPVPASVPASVAAPALAPAPAPAQRAPGDRGWLRAGRDTPAILRLLLASLVAAGLLWGAVTAWTVGQHASAAGQVVGTSEPLSLAAQRMYASLADADVTATTAFLAGPDEPLAVRQRYQSDVAQAGADLARLRGAGATSPRLAASLAAISTGLPIYTGYVEQARTYLALGYPLTGGSFMQVASEEMHLVLLPAARASYAVETEALTAQSGRATGLPAMLVVLALAIVIGVVLFRAQRWLSRRTHRVVNSGLFAASLALWVMVGWLAIAFGTARSDLERGLASGSVPAEQLARAGIAAQQARGDEVLNLISRSGGTSFQQDFTLMSGRTASLLMTALAAAPSGPGAGPGRAAVADARRWTAATGQVFTLDLAASYAAETKLVLGSAGATAFARLQADLRQAITADQAVFAARAGSGSAAFGGLEAGVIVAALVIAAGSAFGLSRRLAEYQ